MDIINYNSEDFASDESFIAYCLQEKDADTEFWDNWITHHPEKQKEVTRAKQLVAHFSLHLSEEEQEEEKAKILHFVENHKKALPLKGKRRQLNSTWKYIIRVAAIILFPVVSIIIYNQYNANHKVAKEEVYIVKQNPPGQKSTIFLSDGSKVILNSDSRIEYSKNFNEENRTIRLMGEAFFEVAANPMIPFVVISGDIKTTALGTSFNIKAFKGGEGIAVSLITGKASVEPLKQRKSQEKIMILTPGEAAMYTATKQSIELYKFDQKGTTAWKEGLLYFKEVSFYQVIATLERWYGVTIDVTKQGTAPYKHYSGEFDNQSLEFVLDALSYTNNFEYTINGKNVAITFINSKSNANEIK